ncbi:hypothetical protein GCM10018962_87090 [Dactylosporangium matsuzakiense]|uniref:Uncharacterized protein n=1 Tax=Dactylosporangium matsuzakiense TaxID=53360 RepID=A0A9W6KGS3_9ACTN|nr:hypothetical protein GCM10017581_035430 [Dactylosporangium matsuzakiense]
MHEEAVVRGGGLYGRCGCGGVAVLRRGRVESVGDVVRVWCCGDAQEFVDAGYLELAGHEGAGSPDDHPDALGSGLALGGYEGAYCCRVQKCHEAQVYA